jgi:renal tumor antigen
MQLYRLISKKGEGTFSEVMRAVHTGSGEQFAIKCMKKPFQSIEEVNNLLEIQALRRLRGHPHIVQLKEIVFEREKLNLVFELMEMNLYEAIKDRSSYLPEGKVVKWMHELFLAMEFMHSRNIFHRDVKPENLLLIGDVLKLADLGSCCWMTSKQPLTEYISTRWYRAPECLLTSGHYSAKMDIWAAGCVFFEVMTLSPLFPGRNETDQIDRIHAVLGTPSDDVLAKFRSCAENHLKEVVFAPVKGAGFSHKLTHCSRELVFVIQDLLTYEQSKRPTSSQVLKSRLFVRFRERQRDSPTSTASSPRSVQRLVLPNVKSHAVGTFPSLPLLHPQQKYTNPYFKVSPRSRSHVFPTARQHSIHRSNLSKIPIRAPSLATFVLASARRANA